MLALKELFKLNNSPIMVTKVVHRLKLNSLTFSIKDKLSTTMYKTPSISNESPTIASGHLQIPSSK